jgi:hypothetical protein
MSATKSQLTQKEEVVLQKRCLSYKLGVILLNH